MSKVSKKVTFEEEEPREDGEEPTHGKKFKHTLDSDEEDDEVNEEHYNVMEGDAVDGFEKATVEFDGDIQITPFNVDDELETGHFDKDGTYIFKKESAEDRDNWLDNIDWSKVNQKQKDSKNKDDEDEQAKQVDTEDLYKQIIALVKPAESIQRAIQRFGKNCPKPQRGQKRKQQQQPEDPEKLESKASMLKLISIADELLSTGDMDIYERTYEQIQLQLSKIAKKSVDVDADEDMFGDGFDTRTSTSKPTTSSASDGLESDEIKWQFKWEDKPEAPIYGPHTSSEMLAWVNSDYFKDGVFVRRIDSSDSKFYTSKRIDFDLYI